MESVNLLSEGMFLDSHPSLQPKGSYRTGLNGNLISHAGNHYVFEETEGTALNWTMPLHITGGTKFVPIGIFRMGDKLIIHSTDSKTTNGGDGEIGLVTFDNAGNGTYVAYYYHSALYYTQAHMIFGYGIEENDFYHRQYWTDDFNQGRTMNTANSIFTTNIASGFLTPGDTYMVLTNSIGNIEYPVGSGVFYGPKQPISGNLFVATAGNTTYTSVGSVTVIKYVDVNIFNYTPNKAIGTIDFVQYNFGGSVSCGVKLYAYRLVTNDGYNSSWSFTTNPISVTSSNPTASDGYKDYVGQGAAGVAVNSTKIVLLRVNDIPQEFDRIQVAVIEVDLAYDIIGSITIFYDEAITATSMLINHQGGEDLQSLIIEDLELITATVVRFKDITTIKQRQIIANLTSRAEIDFDPTGATVSPLIYTMPTDTYFLTNATPGLAKGIDVATGTPAFFKHGYCPSAGIPLTGILVGGHYVVRGTGSILYNGTVYNVGDTFVGVQGASGSGFDTYSVVAPTPIVKGCIRIKRYDKFAGGQEYQIIDIENEFFDYKSMASSMYLKGHFREETYRTAALAWDLFGNPFAIRFMADITMPSISDLTGLYGLLNENNAYLYTQYYAQILGLTVSGLDITAIKDKISGISIVRVKRDKTILGQGLMWQNVRSKKNMGVNGCVPIATIAPVDDWNIFNYQPVLANTFGIMGPEFDFDLKPIQPIVLQAGDRLTVVADLSPVPTTGGVALLHNNGDQSYERVGFDNEIYSKFYIHHPYTISNTIGKSHTLADEEIDKAFSIGLGETFLYDTTTNLSFVNKDITNGTAVSPAPSAALGTAILNKTMAMGGERTVIVNGVTDYFNGSNGDVGTGTVAGDWVNKRKLLANYVRPKSLLYGGNSDVAKSNNRYQYCGHYLKITPQVLTDIHDAVNDTYILNGLEVFGGDCFINLYDRVTSVYDDVIYGPPGAGSTTVDGATANEGSYSLGFVFPVESEINVALREGKHMAKDGLHFEPTGVSNNYSGTSGRIEDIKSYNFAYSTENDLILYDALGINFKDVTRYPYMARYSQFKNLGETTDNMRIFLINNFRNVNALHGEITNIMVGGDKLFYLQRRGIGYIPIEEREITPGALGQVSQLGVGGIAQRYDGIDRFYGCQHQSSLIMLEDKFMFWDMNRFSIISFGFSGRVEDSTVIKGIETHFQNAFLSAQTNPDTILNKDQPMLGKGVIGVYDPIKKTAYMTFKFGELISTSVIGKQTEIQKDFTIGIASMLNKFVGFFSFTPVIYAEINSRVYEVHSTRNTIFTNTVYVVGSEVGKNGDNYVCVLGFTTGNVVGANEQPDFVGSIYWLKTSSENQISRMYAGDICKFDGIVYPHYIDIVVNGDKGDKAFDCAECYGNEIQYSDVICSTENQSASDLNITANNKDYKYFGGRWNFSYPLVKGKGRLSNEYMIVRLQMKNWITNIVTALNVQKRTVYLLSKFRLKK